MILDFIVVSMQVNTSPNLSYALCDMKDHPLQPVFPLN